MRKLFLFVLLVSSAFVAQAAPWFAGLNALHELVTSVTDANGNDLVTVTGRPIIDLYNEDGSRAHNSITDATDFSPEEGETDDPYSFETWNFSGVSWTERVALPWEALDSDGKPKEDYLALKSIAWPGFGYIQKPGSEIIWQQYDIYDPTISGSSVSKDAAQDNSLQYLESLNFSGNKFIHFELDGAYYCPVTSIDFSNNPTLEALVILNCPELEEVNITNNGFRLAKIYEISQTVLVEEPSILKYAPQGTIELSFPLDAVDLSADAVLGTTATSIVWTGAQPVSEANGVFTFAVSDEGKTITAQLSNSELGSESIVYTITLTEATTGIDTDTPSFGQKVRSAGKQLFVSSNTAGIVRIYTMDGRLVKRQNIGAGTSSVALDNSLYLVRFDNGAVHKVLVK